MFVYGTLMPGHLRWGLIAPFAVSHRPATADGQLYDTGQGWPAASFHATLHPATGADRPDAAAPPEPGGAQIEGWLVEVDPASVSSLLTQLDEVEGAVVADEHGRYPEPLSPGMTPGDYRRVRVRAHDGTEAWAYEALEVPGSWTPIAVWTGQHEN